MARDEQTLTSLGLPPTFTAEDLRGGFTREEIQALASGDDPLLDAEALPDDLKAVEKAPTAFNVAKGWVDPDPETPDEDEDEDPDAPKAAAGTDDDDDDPDAGEEGQGTGDAPAKAGQEPGAPDASAITLPEALNEPDPEPEYVDPAPFEEAVAAFDGKLIDLQAQYDDGELNATQFQTALRDLTKEQAKAQADLDRAAAANQGAEAALETAWAAKVTAFVDANPAFVDTTPIPGLQNGESARDVFDGALRHVTANAAAMGTTTMAEQIRVASEMANRYIFVSTGKQIAAEPTAKPAKATREPGPRTDPRPDPVQTLGRVTSVQETMPRESTFDFIDAIEDPIEAEAAIAKLTPAQQKAFLMGA